MGDGLIEKLLTNVIDKFTDPLSITLLIVILFQFKQISILTKLLSDFSIQLSQNTTNIARLLEVFNSMPIRKK